jgi:hypothetical protein
MSDEIQFKQWLLSESRKRKLAIFDFDSTLALTPERPEGWVGSPVRGKKSKDWWTHPDSLSMPHYDGKLNPPIVKAFLAAKSDPETHAAMLTGRMGMRTAPAIRSHLHKHGLYGKRVIGPNHAKSLNRAAMEDPTHDRQHHDDAHEEYYKGDFRKEPDYPKDEKGKPLDDTLNHKLYIVKRLMHQGIEELDFYDDREEHRSHFLENFKSLLGNFPNLRTIRLHAVSPDHIEEHTIDRDNAVWRTKMIPINGKVILPQVQPEQ